ncbi:hypothetical protein MMC07_000050 [Pseudocyphellaria aurata]|nr:hypothetical protein [Pseudocyphellaria aurata]
MPIFVEKLLCNGEEVISVTILLETEWSSMEGKVQAVWVGDEIEDLSYKKRDRYYSRGEKQRTNSVEII